MKKLSFANGQYYHSDELHMSSLDRAVHFGDACYETVYCYKGHLLSYEEHIERLATNLKTMGIEVPATLHCLKPIILTLMQANTRDHEGYAFICISAGTVTKRCLKREKASALVIVHFFTQKFQHKNIDYIQLANENRWALPSIKSTSLIANVAAANISSEEKHLTLYKTKEGFITEGTHYNIFLVRDDGTLVTTEPSQDILVGCTRNRLIALAKKGNIPVEETPIHQDDFSKAKEVIGSSSLMHVGRILQLQDKTFTDTTVTDKLRNLYSEYVKSL